MVFPFLDILSSLSNRFLSIPISPGIAIKGILFFVFIYYILKSLPLLLNEKLLFKTYVFIAITIIVSFIINLLMKDPFSFVEEVMFTFKICYFFIVLIATHLWFKQNLKRTKLYTYLVGSAIVYNVFIWLPYYLGISFNAYKYNKEGTVGWFYSANELSAILACLFPIVAILYFKQKDISKWLVTIGLLSFLPSFFVIGTKVSFAIGFVYSLLFALMIVGQALTKKRTKYTFILAIGFLFFTFYQFNSPAVSNTEQHLAYEEPKVEEVEEGTEIKIIDPNVLVYPEPIHPLLNKILSDRDVYLKLHWNYLNDNLDENESKGLYRVFYGMGYASDYSIEAKQIEMDFFDLAFSYGLFFTVALLILFGLYAFKMLKNMKAVKSFAFRVFAFVGMGIALGISFLTGHVIVSPSPSFYFAFLVIFISYYFIEILDTKTTSEQ